MYANVRYETDFTKWDGHNIEELRGRIIRELVNYLNSGECPEDCEPEYRDTLRKLQTEFDPANLRKLVQDYYFDYFDSMQFWNADPEEAAGGDFSVYREVLGIHK